MVRAYSGVPRRGHFLRAALLASAAPGLIAALLLQSERASAACIIGATVTCDLNNQATGGTLSGNFTTVNVNPGGKIDIGGAFVIGNSVFNHTDTTFGIVNTTPFGRAIELFGFGGPLTYTGSAGVTGFDGIVTHNIDGFGINITQSAGLIGATADGGRWGIRADDWFVRFLACLPAISLSTLSAARLARRHCHITSTPIRRNFGGNPGRQHRHYVGRNVRIGHGLREPGAWQRERHDRRDHHQYCRRIFKPHRRGGRYGRQRFGDRDHERTDRDARQRPDGDWRSPAVSSAAAL